MMTILFMQSVLLQDISSDAVKAKIKTEDTLEYSRTIEEGLRKENDALAKERNELRAELEKAQSRLEEAEQSKQAAEELAESATKNLERVGAITKDIFSISDESLEMLTNNLNPEQADRLRNDVERLKEISDSKALEELMKLDELRKRCDFWKIHITYDGFVSMEINDKEKGRFYIQDTSEAILTDFNKIVTENEVFRLSRNRTSQPAKMCRLERRSHEQKPQTFYRRGEGGLIASPPGREDCRIGNMPGAESATDGFLSLATGIL
jgi:cell division protein FtsB